MSKNKSKIVKWEYVTKPFDVLVFPKTVKRVHSPLERSLSPHYTNGGACILILHLRPCVQGLDEYGAVVKYLYCTRDGRFFARGKDGWSEKKYNYSPAKQNSKKGSSYPQMSLYDKHCHLCVAYAWLGARPEGMVCDHLDTNKLNFCADNLQWVTVKENCRRRKIAYRLKNKVGIDPKLLTPTLLRGIFGLPEEYIGEFIGRYLMACEECEDPMEIWSIRTCVAIALDAMRAETAHELNDLNEN